MISLSLGLARTATGSLLSSLEATVALARSHAVWTPGLSKTRRNALTAEHVLSPRGRYADGEVLQFSSSMSAALQGQANAQRALSKLYRILFTSMLLPSYEDRLLATST
ncbi:hypothetical protein OH77DRAFT_1431009, partial [Trametes cingulata]